MNVGFDINGTINANPLLYSAISHGLKKKKIKVHVITSQPEERRKEIEKELKSYDFHYDVLHLPAFNGSPEWKREVVKENDISVIFDDCKQNLAVMPPNIQTLHMKGPGTSSNDRLNMDLMNIGVLHQLSQFNTVNITSGGTGLR